MQFALFSLVIFSLRLLFFLFDLPSPKEGRIYIGAIPIFPTPHDQIFRSKSGPLDWKSLLLLPLGIFMSGGTWERFCSQQ